MRKFERRILITGDSGYIKTPAGVLMLQTCANLVARFARNVDLALGNDVSRERDDVQGLLQRVDATVNVRVAPDAVSDAYAAVLSIGRSPVRLPRLVEIGASGWDAVLSPGRLTHDAILSSDVLNPFGALVASALGASEVFKHLVGLRQEKGCLLSDSRFSVLELSGSHSASSVALPPSILLPPTLLAGVGAVGNAFLYALHEVNGLRGSITVIDRQTIDDASNLNRYLLALDVDFRPTDPLPKTDLAVRLFEGSNVSVHPIQTDVETMDVSKFARPRCVVSALDDNDPRYAIQNLWPDLLIEGATSDTLAQVSRHEYGSGLACLRCIHPPQKNQNSYIERLHDKSGLPQEWLAAATADPDLLFSADVLAGANETFRPELRKHLGKPACSVLSAIEQFSVHDPEELPFAPAVSFVSAMAGFLAAAEVVKAAIGLPSRLQTLFQMDLMFPLENSILQPVKESRSCYCVRRKSTIAEYRRQTIEGSLR